MNTLSRKRRLVLALLPIAVSAFAFRGQVSDALITRGDDQLRYGDRGGAITYYRRALRFQPANSTAADRLAFTMVMGRDRFEIEQSLNVATAALVSSPGELGLLADRALAEMKLGRTREAAQDFARAARLGHDARYATFASRLALKAGEMRLAREQREDAVRDDPRFAPAIASRRRAKQ